MENDNIVRAAIGRVAYIGDLYDARSDKFCGISIFKTPPPPSAVRITDNQFAHTQFIHLDTYSDKFDKLNIKAELKVSLMAGLFPLEGHGKYLSDEKKSAKSVRSSLLYNIQTKVEQINLFSEQLKQCFALDALNFERATHVVVEVSWGANSMITMEYANLENRNKKEIEGSLQTQLKRIAFSVSGNAEVDYGSGEKNKDESFSIQIFSDVLPFDNDLPQGVDEGLNLMKKMPQFIQRANDGKGKPLQYTMVPLSTLEKYLKVNHMADRLVKTLDEQAIVRFMHIFDENLIVKQQLNDLYNDMQNHNYCISNEIIKKVRQTKTDFEAAEANLRSKLAKILIHVRSGISGAEQLETIRAQFENGNFTADIVRDIINKYLYIVEKMSFADMLINNNVLYIGHGAIIESEKMKNPNGDIYVLFFGETQLNQKLWGENQHLFMSLIRDAKNNSNNEHTMTNEIIKTTFIAVDLDIRPELADREGVKNEIQICHYKNGKYIKFNILSKHLTRQSSCLAQSLGLKELITKTPDNKVILELRCPGSIDGACEIYEYIWVCSKCNEVIEHCFDGFFYCSCGRACSKNFQFKCNSEQHGLNFLQFSEENLIKLLKNNEIIQINPTKEINILIVGETGVGKSTWINGIYNYMSYPSLTEASKHNLLRLIETSFKIEDNSEIRVITSGIDDNEVHVTDQSATQKPKSYEFEWDNTIIRLIDTPGIGNTCGIEQDKNNFHSILKYLANFQQLNGICILLKPENLQLIYMFEYYIKGLLTYFHKNAMKNIVFCFTNARMVSYYPDDALQILKTFLSNNNIKIELSDQTIYSIDNESFRFLCAIQHGIQFNNDDTNNCSASWDISASETNRIFNHIASLKPHVISETISLNNAKKVINLTPPLDNIIQDIHTMSVLLEEQTNEISVLPHIDAVSGNMMQNNIGLVNYIENLKIEYRLITYVSVKFGCYVKYNAIIPYNDALPEYLKHLIEYEKVKVNVYGDDNALIELENMQKDYSEGVCKFVELTKINDNVEKLTLNDINILLQQLYALPISGSQLKQIMDAAIISKSTINGNENRRIKNCVSNKFFKNE